MIVLEYLFLIRFVICKQASFVQILWLKNHADELGQKTVFFLQFID